MLRTRLLPLVLASASILFPSLARGVEKPNIPELIKEKSPQAPLKRIQVQDGYKLELAASEPMIVEPTIAGFVVHVERPSSRWYGNDQRAEVVFRPKLF